MKTLTTAFIIGIACAALHQLTNIVSTIKTIPAILFKDSKPKVQYTIPTAPITSAYIARTIEDLPKPRYYPAPGLTPKEYGMRYGNGKSRKSKTNKLHTSCKAKLRHVA